MDRFSRGIVEPIHHEKVDDLVPPIRGRWKRPARLTSGRLRVIQDCLDFRRKERCEHNAFLFFWIFFSTETPKLELLRTRPSLPCGTTPSNSNTSIQRPLAHHRVMLSRRVIAYYGLIRASESLPATYGFAAGSAAPKENRLEVGIQRFPN